MISRWLHTFFLALTAALLAGCASTRAVDSAVQSYSTLTALPTPPTYRLELLPSQKAEAASFSAIEAQAQESLQKVGLQRDDQTGGLIVQIGAQARYTSPEYWPYGPYGRPWAWGWGHRGWAMGGGWMMDRPPPCSTAPSASSCATRKRRRSFTRLPPPMRRCGVTMR